MNSNYNYSGIGLVFLFIFTLIFPGCVGDMAGQVVNAYNATIDSAVKQVREVR